MSPKGLEDRLAKKHEEQSTKNKPQSTKRKAQSTKGKARSEYGPNLKGLKRLPRILCPFNTGLL
jgi:hypothetical protein